MHGRLHLLPFAELLREEKCFAHSEMLKVVDGKEIARTKATTGYKETRSSFDYLQPLGFLNGSDRKQQQHKV